jgi:hypothetical protein
MKITEDDYITYYENILDVCKSCDLYFEDEDSCLINNKLVFEIVKSESPICPIGNW